LLSTDPGNNPDSQHSISVNFDGQPPADVSVLVRSNNGVWTGETLSVVEEQIDRMLQRGAMEFLSYKRGSPFFTLVIVTLMSLGSALLITRGFDRPGWHLADRMWLSDQDLRELEPIATNPALAKDHLAEVLSRQIGNVLRDRRAEASVWVSVTRWRSILIFAPALVIALAFLYLLFKCYRSAVFPWGDAEEWYKSITNRRRFIWSAMIASLLVGILGNLFVFALSSRG
jgi:hypothetical protein